MTEKKQKIVVQTSVKDENLIELRRQQIVDGALKLFKEKGFHRATTREIAKAAGFSIGTLYEYIRTKEDVLYLVCNSIYKQVIEQLSDIKAQSGTVEELTMAIRQYFLIIDGMVDEITIMYQETKTLPKETRRYVLTKELEMVALFEELLKRCVKSGEISLTDEEAYLAANQLIVQGQSWAFRKWALQKDYTIEDYIQIQTKMFIKGITHFCEVK